MKITVVLPNGQSFTSLEMDRDETTSVLRKSLIDVGTATLSFAISENKKIILPRQLIHSTCFILED